MVEKCDLGNPYSFSAFIFMAALLCLVLPVLLMFLLVYQIAKEYNSPPFIKKCLKFVSIRLARVFLAIYVVVLFGQIAFSVYIAIFAYGKFEDWQDDKINCTNTTFYSAFSSLTALYILILIIIIALAYHFVLYIRKRAFVRLFLDNLKLPISTVHGAL